MQEVSVFILTLNYNGWRDTVECLESVQRLTYPNYRIVVIDNGSADGSMERIKAWASGELCVESEFLSYDPSTEPVLWIEYDRVTAEAGGLPELEAQIEGLPPNRRMVLIQTGANLGYAGGNNVGIRYALKRGAKSVWLLNNDTFVARESLTELVNVMQNAPDTAAVGSVVFSYDRPKEIQAAGGSGVPWLGKVVGRRNQRRARESTHLQFECDYVPGSSMLVSSRALRNVGLLDESFFMYWEEVDWCMRARRAGWRVYCAPKSLVWHKTGALKLHGQEPVYRYYHQRNRLLFVRRNYPQLLPLALFLGLVLGVGGKLLLLRWAEARAEFSGWRDFWLGRTGRLSSGP